MISKVLLEKIGEGVFLIIGNQLTKDEKDAIEFLWKCYFKFEGEWVDSYLIICCWWLFQNLKYNNQ